MPIRKETQLYNSVKSLLPLVHWQRIESGAIGQGIPDINACFQGIEFWIELKIIVGHRFRSPLKAFQAAWITRRTNAGGRCFILAEKSCLWYLWRGDKAIKLCELGPKKVAPNLKLMKPINKTKLLKFLLS